MNNGIKDFLQGYVRWLNVSVQSKSFIAACIPIAGLLLVLLFYLTDNQDWNTPEFVSLSVAFITIFGALYVSVKNTSQPDSPPSRIESINHPIQIVEPKSETAQEDESIIQNLQNELQKAHDELENRVAERTADLRRAYEKLSKESLDRKSAEITLLKRERTLATLINNLPGMAYHTKASQTMTMTYASDGCFELTGLTMGMIKSKPEIYYECLIHPSDLYTVLGTLHSAVESHTPYQVTYRINTPSGEKWVMDRGQRVESGDGANYLEGFITDISSQKQYERELSFAKEEWERTFDSIPELITLLDPQGKIKRVNSELCRRLDRRPEELTGKYCWDVLHQKKVRPDFYPDDLSSIHRTKTFELKEVHLGGEFLISISPLFDNDGEINGYVHYAHDISELSQLEKQLAQSQKMEAVGRLAGGIVHDFNNLMMVIQGFSEIALLSLDENDPVAMHLAEVKKAGERASALTHQLLAFSRKQVMKKKSIDINKLIIDMDKLLRRVIGEDIELVTVFHESIAQTHADPSQLEQIIMNLVVNARDAMPNGGKLTITTENIFMDETVTDCELPVIPGKYVLLSIYDTGCGIDEATQKKIFEPFFTTKEHDKGTGLGLSTVYGIVQQTDGNISITSVPGQGTTFKIYFPKGKKQSEQEQKIEELKLQFIGSETILVVEDEDMVRSVVCATLRQKGYTVLEAINGVNALDLCKKSKPPLDLLLTDVVMPVMGGRELAEQILEYYPDITILFMSGYTDDAVIHRGILREEIELIQKPVLPHDLSKSVRNALDKKKA